MLIRKFYRNLARKPSAFMRSPFIYKSRFILSGDKGMNRKNHKSTILNRMFFARKLYAFMREMNRFNPKSEIRNPKSIYLLKIILVSAILFVSTVYIGWTEWIANVTITNSAPLDISETLTFGTDTSVGRIRGPFPQPPLSGNYLIVAFKHNTFERYYVTYTDVDGPWLLCVQTNVDFTLEWNGLGGIDDGVYHVSQALYDANSPREDWGLLRSQSSVDLPSGKYFIRITKIEESTRTASLVSGQSIAFQADDYSTGVAIELVSGNTGNVTVSRTDTAPEYVNPNLVLPQNWQITNGLDAGVKLRFYYLDADVLSLGIDETDLKLAYTDSGSWQILGPADIEEHNTTGSAGYFQTGEIDHFSQWAIGTEEGFDYEPLEGDVSGDTIISAYDAVLIFQHITGIIQLSEAQQNIGNVDGKEGLTANDAKQILKKTVGLINQF